MGISVPPTKRERRRNARIAALTRWAKEDIGPAAHAGQAGLLERFRREALEARPDLTEPELTICAERLRSAHMMRLAKLSADARRMGAA
jgi:hypothetical protein